MKTNSKKTKKGKSVIEKQFSRIPIKKLAKQSGFCKRKARKIKPKDLIIAFIQTIASKRSTYSNWANQIGILINGTVSKQAVSKRMREPLILFLKSVLKKMMEDSLRSRLKGKACEKLRQFNRILIEDSTSIKLNNKLSKAYPGNKNGNATDYAILKIQSTYDILKKRFIRLDITNFRKNDQGYSANIFQIAKAGDLIIRDLGYFVLGVFKRLSQEGIYFVSRLHKRVNIYITEEKPIDLASMLKKRGVLDIEVFLGEDKLPTRLVAIPVEEGIAEKRRRNARNNRDRRLNPSKEHLYLLGWNIFITNVGKEKLDINDIVRVYSIRWRIEIIFKTWKSSMGIAKTEHEVNKIKLEAFIYCMLIFILLFQVHLYEYCINNQRSKSISLMKLMHFIMTNLTFVIYVNCLNSFAGKNKLLNKQIRYYCTYENRSDKVNYDQLIGILS
ncbi:IS4 family transposase [bacterium]|nr:MAG: IS4 family transposase [bacterium]